MQVCVRRYRRASEWFDDVEGLRLGDILSLSLSGIFFATVLLVSFDRFLNSKAVANDFTRTPERGGRGVDVLAKCFGP